MVIKTCNTFIFGYTQHRDRLTGIARAWGACQAETRDPSIVNRGPMAWDVNWRLEARFVRNFCNEATQHNIFAYSWGAGWGAMEYARQLWTAGNYEHVTMVLADPVFCDHRPWMRWNTISNRYEWMRKVIPQKTILIPRNVDEVWWSRQENNWPRAMSLEKEIGQKTIIHTPEFEHDLGHARMDDADWFQDKVKEIWLASV